MKKNRVGSSNLFISAYTLGCMSLGTNEKMAYSIIDEAISYGVNHLDTADLYDFGRNEEIVAKAIKQRRNDLIITTKVGNHFNKRDGTWFWDPSKEYIERAVQDSLVRLETDYIDLYLLHGGTIDDPIDETIEAFERLKEKGVIRAYGISSIRPNVIHSYLNKSNIDAIMMQYSMLDRRPEGLLKTIANHDVSVLARGPIAKGILTDKWQEIISMKAQNGYLDYDKDSLIQTLQQLSRRFDDDLASYALQYVLYDHTVASAVFGASHPQQVKSLLTKLSQSTPLKTSVHSSIREMTKPLTYTAHL